ncbi:MAG: glycoside hydrolase family 16 protein [Planctomycetota bacterium]
MPARSSRLLPGLAAAVFAAGFTPNLVQANFAGGVGSTITEPALVDSGHDYGLDLLWHDEFNGTQLDDEKWNHRRLGSRREATNVTDAVSVGGGNLSIKAYTENGQHYTGMIGTEQTFQHTYGYWEARIDFNGDSGMWSAFWLQSPDVENHAAGPSAAGVELDVVEFLADEFGSGNSAASLNAHWGGYGAHHQKTGTNVRNPELDEGFHTYGILWTPEGYEWYINGEKVWDGAGVPMSDRDQYIILSNEVGIESWSGGRDPNGYGSLAETETEMIVDYVRVWSLGDGAPVPEPTSLSLLALGGLALRRRR